MQSDWEPARKLVLSKRS